ncbi:MAG: 30S ribosomal protein S4 [Myxococcales bacterium]|nr:30S ribosomal protein S4 [Myxococcales bacterium]
MSRYTGPRVKVMRALGVDLPGLSKKTIERRPYAPGQHGQNRRKKLSDFGRQLKEKQKLRYNYGISEVQFRRLVVAARASKLAAGDKLLELLERRLDNAVFRAGYAPTIPAARQLVTHGHFTVNGRRVDRASFSVNPGDVIRPRERSLTLGAIQTSLGSLSLARPEWMEFDAKRLTTRVKSVPTADSVPFPIDVQLVIEYYSKRM